MAMRVENTYFHKEEVKRWKGDTPRVRERMVSVDNEIQSG